jgi:type VI protein secretion system component VasF
MSVSRQDLENLESRLKARVQALERREAMRLAKEQIEKAVKRQTRTIVLVMWSSMLAAAAIAFAAARLV